MNIRSLCLVSLVMSLTGCGSETSASEAEDRSAITEDEGSSSYDESSSSYDEGSSSYDEGSSSYEPQTCEEAPEVCVPPTDEEVGEPPLDSSLTDSAQLDSEYQGAPEYSDYSCTWDEEAEVEECVVQPGPSLARRLFCSAAWAAGARICNKYVDANLVAQGICGWYCPWKFPGEDLGSRFKRTACGPICRAKVVSAIGQYEPMAKAWCNSTNDWLYDRCMGR